MGGLNGINQTPASLRSQVPGCWPFAGLVLADAMSASLICAGVASALQLIQQRRDRGHVGSGGGGAKEMWQVVLCLILCAMPPKNDVLIPSMPNTSGLSSVSALCLR